MKKYSDNESLEIKHCQREKPFTFIEQARRFRKYLLYPVYRFCVKFWEFTVKEVSYLKNALRKIISSENKISLLGIRLVKVFSPKL
jgi:hypothetical protein